MNGTDDLTVWRTSKWYMRQKNNPKEKIPRSCCRSDISEEDIGRCLQVDLSHPDESVVYHNTCYAVLKSDLLEKALVAGWLSIATSLLLVRSFLLARPLVANNRSFFSYYQPYLVPCTPEWFKNDFSLPSCAVFRRIDRSVCRLSLWCAIVRYFIRQSSASIFPVSCVFASFSCLRLGYCVIE